MTGKCTPNSYYRSDSFVSRHFVYTPDEVGGTGSSGSAGDGDCPGESEAREKLNVIAHTRLEEGFSTAEVELEGHVAGRFADFSTLPGPRSSYRKGIAVEPPGNYIGVS